MPEAEAEAVCPVCGEAYAEFQKTGLFGCSSCYETFAPQLDALFRRIHGVARHIPDMQDGEETTEGCISVLAAQLRQAVAREAFEEAGRLRDRIEALRDPARNMP